MGQGEACGVNFLNSTEVELQAQRFVASIAGRLGLGEDEALRMGSLDAWTWGQGRLPVTFPLEWRAAMAVLDFQGRHPYQDVLSPDRQSYEVLAPDEGAAVALMNPWVNWPRTPVPARDLVLRKIEPHPKTRDVFRYARGFSTNTGRSVDFAIRHRDGDGVLWNHLNAVGVGQTLKARRGIMEMRDGKLPLSGAFRRFYFSNLMHFAAGPLGFRTSLAMAVVNRGELRVPLEEARVKKLEPQVASVIYELRREQLRLGDLFDGVNPGVVIQAAKQKIAEELSREAISDAEYVTWLARTLGEQFAIMTFFEFDHGLDNGASQVHSGNFSLAGEVFDFDTARFHPDAGRRYLDLAGYANPVTLADIRRFEKPETPMLYNWVRVFQIVAPDVRFGDELEKAYYTKLQALLNSDVDPKSEIERFNRERWQSGILLADDLAPEFTAVVEEGFPI